MAARRMSVCTGTKLKFITIIVIFIMGLQLFWFLPWMQYSQPQIIDNNEGNIPPINVAVFYEALCPDSKNFLMRQLRPAFEKASRLISVKLVPYGKAKTLEDNFGNLTFSCQHGPTECLGNKVHACAANVIANENVLVQYTSCMIASNYDPLGIGHSCAIKMNIDWNPILQCSKSREGDLLLKTHGEETNNLRPRVSFIPTITLNGSQQNQAGILKNLLKSVCSLYRIAPEECKDTDDVKT